MIITLYQIKNPLISLIHCTYGVARRFMPLCTSRFFGEITTLFRTTKILTQETIALSEDKLDFSGNFDTQKVREIAN